MDGEGNGGEEGNDDRRRDQPDNEYADPARGRERVRRAEEKDDAGDRRDREHEVPAARAREAATEVFQAESTDRGGIESVGCHPDEEARSDRSSGDECDSRCPKFRPVASSDQRRAVRSEDGCRKRVEDRQGCGQERVRHPAPSTPALERDDQKESDGDDSQDPKRVRASLTRRYDDAGVGGERDSGDDPSNASEQHRAEHDDQCCGEGDRDRRRRPDRSLIGADGGGTVEDEQVS